MLNLAYQIIRTARPRQWLKNISLFAAPVFVGTLFTDNVFSKTTYAFIAFSVLSSSIYFINDIIDAPKDRLHPIKKNRAIASGKLPASIAWVIAVTLLLSTLLFADQFVGTYFVYMQIGYFLLMLSYIFYFRNVIILDSLVVATGFVVRVFAGGIASSTSISSWLALTTIGISILLAFGKRRSEKTILAKFELKAGATRATLQHYPDALLDSMISMSSAFTIISYSIFTFQTSTDLVNKKLISILPSILRSPKLMMLTIPLVIYGVARYLYVIYEKKEGESPARALLGDKPLLITVVLWGTIVLSLIYLLPQFG